MEALAAWLERPSLLAAFTASLFAGADGIDLRRGTSRGDRVRWLRRLGLLDDRAAGEPSHPAAGAAHQDRETPAPR